MSLQRDMLKARRLNYESEFSSPHSSIPEEFTRPSVVSTNNERETLSGETVRVAVRVRPPFTSETSQTVIVEMDPSKGIVSVEGRMVGKEVFFVDMPLWSCNGMALDGSFPVTQSALYEHVGRPLLHHALEGFNSTVIAYGQTGSGKTYTMMGEIGQNVGDDEEHVLNDGEEGIIPRLCRDMFKNFQDRSFVRTSGESVSWEVYVSFVEVYCEKISDLLDNGKYVSLRDEIIDNETHFSLVGARRLQATKTNEVLHALRTGNKFRKTSTTQTNDRSSRSHAVFILELTEVVSFLDSAGEMVKMPNKQLTIRLVDLAGSERLGETDVQGQRFKETVEINLSLFTLGMVIESLTDGKRRGIKPPYRESTLTKLLKDAFGGNSKTTMICTIAPTAAHRSQTLQTLQYGSKARHVLNRPKVAQNLASVAMSKLSEELTPSRNKLLDAKSEAGKHQDSLREQLAQVIKKLREEQDISRCLRLSIQQKDKKLALRKREIEDQQRVYDTRIQEVESELERTKVKQKERERELRKASLKAAVAAEESRKEMNLQRAALQEYLQQKCGEMLRSQQESERHMKSLWEGLDERLEGSFQKVNTLKKKLKMGENVIMKLGKVCEEAVRREKRLRSKLSDAHSMIRSLKAKASTIDGDTVNKVAEIQDTGTKNECGLSEGAGLTHVARGDSAQRLIDVQNKPEGVVNYSFNNNNLVQFCKEESNDLNECAEKRHAGQETQVKHVEKEQIELDKNINEQEQYALQVQKLDPQEHRQDDEEKTNKLGERSLSGSYFGRCSVNDTIDGPAGSMGAMMFETTVGYFFALSSGHAENLAVCFQMCEQGKKVLSLCGPLFIEFLESASRAALMAQEGQESCFIIHKIQHEERRAMGSQLRSGQEISQERKIDILRAVCSCCGADQLVVEKGERCQLLLEEIQSSGRCIIKQFKMSSDMLHKGDALGNALCSVYDIGTQTCCSQMLSSEDVVGAEKSYFLGQNSITGERYFQSEERRTSQKTEQAKVHLISSDLINAGSLSANSFAGGGCVSVDGQLCESEAKLDDSIKNLQPTTANQSAAQMTERIAMWEASERECIERLFQLQLELHLSRYVRGCDFATEKSLLFMEKVEGGEGEGHLSCRDAELDVKHGGDKEKLISQYDRRLQGYSFTFSDGVDGVDPTRKESKQPVCEIEQSCGQLQKGKAEVEVLFRSQVEAQKQEHDLEQIHSQLRRQLADTEQRVQKRIAEIELRRKELVSMAKANERTLKDREAGLQALILKCKDVEGHIRQRDEELERQRLRYMELSKLLEDREKLLRDERAHRISGKQCAIQVTQDLIDVNEFLKRQLEIWMRKYKVLKSDEKVECERCFWQNRRDATVCSCCGNSQLV